MVGLARGLDVARGHRRARSLVRREDVLELRPVDERLVELRVLARRVAEHVFHAGGDAAARRSTAPPVPSTILIAFDARLRVRDRHQRFEDRLRGAERDAGGRHSLQESCAARSIARQVARDELSHLDLPAVVRGGEVVRHGRDLVLGPERAAPDHAEERAFPARAGPGAGPCHMPGAWHWKHLSRRTSLPGASGKPTAAGGLPRCASAGADALSSAIRINERNIVVFTDALEH